MICLDYVLRMSIDIIAVLANTPAQAEILFNNPEQAAGSISFYNNANKTELMFF